jgi:hypothetical protein
MIEGRFKKLTRSLSYLCRIILQFEWEDFKQNPALYIVLLLWFEGSPREASGETLKFSTQS